MKSGKYYGVVLWDHANSPVSFDGATFDGGCDIESLIKFCDRVGEYGIYITRYNAEGLTIYRDEISFYYSNRRLFRDGDRVYKKDMRKYKNVEDFFNGEFGKRHNQYYV